MKSWLLIFVSIFALGGSGLAQAQCRNGSFPSVSAPWMLGTVVGPGRVALMSDTDGCPSPTVSCVARGYLVPGDTVVVGNRSGDYLCVFYPNAVGGSAGFVPVARLTRHEIVSNPPLIAWVGRWRDGDNEIKLEAKAGALVVDGSACWPSCHVTVKERPGGPNVGELSGTALPSGNRVVFSTGPAKFDCTAELTLVGAFLVASDNRGCGGMNVRFDGVYRRPLRHSP